MRTALALVAALALACTSSPPPQLRARRPSASAAAPSPSSVAPDSLAPDPSASRVALIREALACDAVDASSYEDRRIGCALLAQVGEAAPPSPPAAGTEGHWTGLVRGSDTSRRPDVATLARMAVRAGPAGATQIAITYVAVEEADAEADTHRRFAALAAGDGVTRDLFDGEVAGAFDDDDWLTLDPARPGVLVHPLLGALVVLQRADRILALRGDPDDEGHDRDASIAELVHVGDATVP